MSGFLRCGPAHRTMRISKTSACALLILVVAFSFPGADSFAATFTQSIKVSASADDAEQQGGGYFSTTSSDLELVEHPPVQRLGIRFKGVDLRQGTVVSAAYIQFKVDEASSGAAGISILGEAADDAVAFSAAQDIFSRVATVAEVSWSPQDWPQIGVAGPAQQTADIAPVLQEIVNRPGWAMGNSLVVLFEGSGTRVAESFDGDQTGAPTLHIEYELSDQEPPVVDAGVDQTVTLPDAATLDGDVTDDGLPQPPGAVTTTWSQTGGEGEAGFADASLLDTTVSFTAAGTYRLRLTADDGERVAVDELTVIVNPAPLPPEIGSITPGSGQVASVVVINGGNFSSALRVEFGGVSARFRALNDATIHATVPPGAVSGSVGVENPWGGTTSAGEFDVVPSPPVLVGAGDIADCSGNEEATAALLDTIPGTVMAVGDLAYEGVASPLNDCYEPTWGRHKSRTRPVPGNHEYKWPGAEPYYDYFGPTAGDPTTGYYSYDLGTWHIIALNSECAEIGGCDAASPQSAWLREDLANNPSLCTMAYWHIPRYSSALHGSDTTYVDLWQILYDAGVELVVSGHDHTYERFAPQDSLANADPMGVRAFVVGTGGRFFYDVSGGEPNSEVRNDNTHGVLKLTLNQGSYDWEFVPIAGETFTDSGSQICHQVNQLPLVGAGTDQIATWPDDATLDGTAVDDGFPQPPGSLTTLWSQLSGPGDASFENVAAPTTTVSFPQVGVYQLRLTADDGEHVVFDDVNISVLEEGSQIVSTELSIASGLDDVEENQTSGDMYFDSSDLELILDSITAGSDQTVGMRFNGVSIPRDATVVKAHVQFQVDEISTDPTDLTIRGEAADHSQPFSGADGDLTDRTRTAALVSWSPAPWTSVGSAGPDQQTPDLSEIIQQIVDRPGWLEGSSMTLIVDGSGQRTAESFDGDPGAAPRLYVDYLTSSNEAPVVSILAPANGTSVIEGSTVSFSASANDSDDGDVSASIGWTSNLQGVLGGEPSIDAVLVEGNHVVTAVAVDGQGLSGQDQISVTITPAPVDVPDVTGLSQLAAEGDLLSAGLSVGSVTAAASETVDAGEVISQSPTVCTACVAPGSAVDLVISLGPATVDVPNVEGLTQAAAEADIVAAGLTVGAVTSANGDTVPAGSVISQSPTACSACVAPGSAVDLVVSLGPATVDVPNVVGLTQAAAEADIVAAGLTLGTATSANSDTVPVGIVISQNPSACAACAAPGSEVDLVVSSGSSSNTAPVVEITTPTDGARLFDGTSQTFIGTALDAEQGDLSAGLSWTSSKDGALGVGANISATLSRGRHTITATVSDGEGLSDSTEIRVRVAKSR